jgi:hypothetical protein
MSEKSIMSTEQQNGGFTDFSFVSINPNDNFKKNVAHKRDYYFCTSKHRFNIRAAATREMPKSLTLHHLSPGDRGGKPYSHRPLTAEAD